MIKGKLLERTDEQIEQLSVVTPSDIEIARAKWELLLIGILLGATLREEIPNGDL